METFLIVGLAAVLFWLNRDLFTRGLGGEGGEGTQQEGSYYVGDDDPADVKEGSVPTGLLAGACYKCSPITYTTSIKRLVACCVPRPGQSLAEVEEEIRTYRRLISKQTSGWWSTKERQRFFDFLKALYDEGIYSGCAGSGAICTLKSEPSGIPDAPNYYPRPEDLIEHLTSSSTKTKDAMSKEYSELWHEAEKWRRNIFREKDFFNNVKKAKAYLMKLKDAGSYDGFAPFSHETPPWR